MSSDVPDSDSNLPLWTSSTPAVSAPLSNSTVWRDAVEDSSISRGCDRSSQLGHSLRHVVSRSGDYDSCSSIDGFSLGRAG